MLNLTKEYFEQMRADYPLAVEHFFTWLDNYKEEVGWDALFNQEGLQEPPIDFFNIPYEMQNGILARFDIEKFMGKNAYQKLKANEQTRYKNLFKDVQSAIENKTIKYN